MIRACDLKQREVINVANAERLGYIYDVDVDFETGKINSIIIPNKSGMLGMFGKKNDYVVPWDRIVAIGPEIVLVRLDGLDIVRQF
ncbi:MAG TPA: YlmC/YmxH family sporulation protein [Candidatus Avimonoglobus intestinipullorum]|uniref:YlmC/YmxH family sporulation protein n=1 Tax=Candidatus Avimonoglobus intestinipullorum TaxID=2840699 RepID=A0A9D1S705_9FIRM|nr:YlmC/YmxH family sporulation protein [Candidatus Avimonoglobus intestinipullorum]